MHNTCQRLSAALSFSAQDARFEAQLLLQAAAKVNRAWLIAHENDVLQASTQAELELLLNRRLSGEPIAYILGYREFFGLELKVTPDTLIPRPDTETLVEAALGKIDKNANSADASSHRKAHVSVLDLGTGTGAIALAIAKNRPHAQVTATDASQAALNVATENAKNLSISNVRFALSNWFSALKNEKFDLIVSNPPYIEQGDTHLGQGDLRFEPISALASGADGLDDIREIITDSLINLNPQGWLMLEHGYNQATQVTDLMAHAGLVDIETMQDLGGNDRVTIAKNPLIISTHWD
ncbi:MAG: peptide chain release factor N(5)-glutamine methyltransferase [Methylotenera sp.]|nr:peptide chain release factor N(5)-glutamine methyltransferase [Methylotenera sp.]